MKQQAVLHGKADGQVLRPSRIGDWLVLAKVRLNSLAVATAAGGYYMASPEPLDEWRLVAMCAGSALVASGASAVNQIVERDVDRLMQRTATRPLAEGRMQPNEGWVLAGVLSLAGLAVLWLGTTPAATYVALATLVSYAAIYTPLKRHTSFATVVGAVPGALPPLIGWAAVRGSVDGMEPWTLFAIMFVWQLPHFLAIAWMFREDYARAGLPMLSVVDRHGGMTGRQTALWAAALVPVSQLPFLVDLATLEYAAGATLLGIVLFALALRFARHRSIANARILFVASVVYLPLLWLLMTFGRR
jgi:protoheme IX farnesyltransferase